MFIIRHDSRDMKFGLRLTVSYFYGKLTSTLPPPFIQKELKVLCFCIWGCSSGEITRLLIQESRSARVNPQNVTEKVLSDTFLFIVFIVFQRYSELISQAQERHTKLEESIKQHGMLREAKEVESWIQDKVSGHFEY